MSKDYDEEADFARTIGQEIREAFDSLHVTPGWSLALAAYIHHERSGEPVTTVEVYEGTPEQQQLVQQNMPLGIYYIDTLQGETSVYELKKVQKRGDKTNVLVARLTFEGLVKV